MDPLGLRGGRVIIHLGLGPARVLVDRRPDLAKHPLRQIIVIGDDVGLAVGLRPRTSHNRAQQHHRGKCIDSTHRQWACSQWMAMGQPGSGNGKTGEAHITANRAHAQNRTRLHPVGD
ncbi:Hypothetical protein EPM1_3440 [Stenotrophomonas maltophilia EPM1]|nr:Hypothetical protein EPM1_3440 [Stenotrophomonas maltophilia EPM1]